MPVAGIPKLHLAGHIDNILGTPRHLGVNPGVLDGSGILGGGRGMVAWGIQRHGCRAVVSG